METLLIIHYALLLVVIGVTYYNKSRILSLFFGLFFVCDISNTLRQILTSYPKPYEGLGFALFAMTTLLYLAIPMLNLGFLIFSYTNKVSKIPVLFWATISAFLLISYPEVRGASMLNAFYAYYIVGGIACLGYGLTKIRQRITFTQGVFLTSAVASIVSCTIAKKEVSVFHLENWIILVACNCIYFGATILFSCLNRSKKKLLP